jgi:hypothetical protein
MNIDLKELHISDKLTLPTDDDLKAYMRTLLNDGTGSVYVMAQLAIPKLILLVQYYQDGYEQISEFYEKWDNWDY